MASTNILQIIGENDFTNTPRFAYIAQIVFGQLLGLEVIFTNRPAPTLPLLVYSKMENGCNFITKPLANTKMLCLQAADILFETTIKTTYLNEKIRFLDYDKEKFDANFNQIFCIENAFPQPRIPILFANTNQKCGLGFDILAASFFLISRYEEYIITERDAHGRFEAAQSIACRHDFLNLPIIEYWAIFFAQKLGEAFPNLVFKQRKGSVTPTFDIDMAWAFRHKTPLQQLGGIVLDITKLNFKRLKYRFKVLSNLEPDPFFTFEIIENCIAKANDFNKKNNFDIQNDNLENQQNRFAQIFFLLGKYGKYDKNTPIKTPEFQNLIHSLAQKHQVGIHPSYGSNTAIGRLATEIALLAKATQQNITHSRQHFLKLSLPKTYQNLLKNGITHDYSMGYAEQIGFRASISEPFLWFDLSENCATNLTIQPFCIMDVTLRAYLRLSPDDAFAQAKNMIEQTTAIGGQAVLLWHNSSLSDWEEWKGWHELLPRLLE